MESREMLNGIRIVCMIYVKFIVLKSMLPTNCCAQLDFSIFDVREEQLD